MLFCIKWSAIVSNIRIGATRTIIKVVDVLVIQYQPSDDPYARHW